MSGPGKSGPGIPGMPSGDPYNRPRAEGLPRYAGQPGYPGTGPYMPGSRPGIGFGPGLPTPMPSPGFPGFNPIFSPGGPMPSPGIPGFNPRFEFDIYDIYDSNGISFGPGGPNPDVMPIDQSEFPADGGGDGGYSPAPTPMPSPGLPSTPGGKSGNPNVGIGFGPAPAVLPRSQTAAAPMSRPNAIRTPNRFIPSNGAGRNRLI